MELQIVETPFTHEFGEGEEKVYTMNGYIQALNQVLKYIEETTEWKPENRYIDSVPLAEKIQATCKELQPMLSEELIKVLKSQIR